MYGEDSYGATAYGEMISFMTIVFGVASNSGVSNNSVSDEVKNNGVTDTLSNSTVSNGGLLNNSVLDTLSNNTVIN